MEHVIAHFSYSLYSNVMRSLFVKDKLLFPFIMALKIMEGDGKLDMEEFNFLLSPISYNEEEKIMPNVGHGWLPR